MPWPSPTWIAGASADFSTLRLEQRRTIARSARPTPIAQGRAPCSRVWPTRSRPCSRPCTPPASATLAGKAGTIARAWCARARRTVTEGCRPSARRARTAPAWHGTGSIVRALLAGGVLPAGLAFSVLRASTTRFLGVRPAPTRRIWTAACASSGRPPACLVGTRHVTFVRLASTPFLRTRKAP